MRISTWTSVFVLTMVCQIASAGQQLVGNWGDVDDIQFVGNQSFDSAQIRWALGFNMDVLVAGHPQAPMDDFLQLLQTRVRDGYQHMGFAHAKVSARFDERRPAIVIQVEERSRYLCGEVEFEGASTIPTERLALLLTKAREEKPKLQPGSAPSASTILPKLTKVLWKRGKPASFSPGHWQSRHDEIRAAFQFLGYYDAQFTETVRPESDGKATLVISIQDEGPKATLGEIEVIGAQKNTVEDVLKVIDLPLGIVLDSEVRETVEKKLADTARFIKHDVEILTPPFGDDPSILRVRLLEFDNAPPLSEEFSEKQQIMVRLAHWINHLEATDDDLDIKWAGALSQVDETREVPEGTLVTELRLITSHRKQACLLHVRLCEHPNRQIFESWLHLTPELIGLDSPRHGLRYEARDLLQAVVATINWTAKPPDEAGRISNIQFGMGVKSNEDQQLSPFTLKISAAPVAALREASTWSDEMSVQNGLLVIDKEQLQLRIDVQSGRLIQLSREDGPQHRFSVDCRPGLYASTLADYNAQAADHKVIRAGDIPISNLLSFLATCLPERLPEQAASVKTLAPLLQSLLKRGAFHSFDELAQELFNQPDDKFELPKSLDKKPVQFNWTAYSLPIIRRIVPRPSWTWTISREFVFAQTGRNERTGEAIQAMLADGHAGPISHLASAWLLGQFHPQLRIEFARRGLAQLDGISFQSDVEPFLHDRSPIGKLLLATARTLQGVEVGEIESLVEQSTLGEDDRKSLSHVLRQFPQHRDARPFDVLADALDEAWEPLIEPRVRWLLEILAQ